MSLCVSVGMSSRRASCATDRTVRAILLHTLYMGTPACPGSPSPQVWYCDKSCIWGMPHCSDSVQLKCCPSAQCRCWVPSPGQALGRADAHA
eukprot:249832-Chlamydomonas_euryale.AAC.5